MLFATNVSKLKHKTNVLFNPNRYASHSLLLYKYAQSQSYIANSGKTAWIQIGDKSTGITYS